MVFKKKIKKIIKYNFLKGVTRNVVILGLVSLFTDISSQMVFPLIPLFLISVLGAGAYAVGIVEGAAETTASILKVVSGFWSDKIKRRKPFVLFGYSLSTITKPLFALAGVWSFVLFVRVIERIGKGIRDAPRDAIVAESVSRDVRGKAYGFQRSMDGFGSIIGAVLAFFLLPILGYRNIFLFAFIPGVIAVLIIFPLLLPLTNKIVKVQKYQDSSGSQSCYIAGSDGNTPNCDWRDVVFLQYLWSFISIFYYWYFSLPYLFLIIILYKFSKKHA